MKLLKCLMYLLECKKILTVFRVLTTGATILILACTAAKMFVLKDFEVKKIGKALKKVMK